MWHIKRREDLSTVGDPRLSACETRTRLTFHENGREMGKQKPNNFPYLHCFEYFGLQILVTSSRWCRED